MNRLNARLKTINESPVVVAISSVIGIIGILSSLYAWIQGVRSFSIYGLIIISLISGIAGVAAMINLREEVNHYRESYKQIHRINHRYRDALTDAVSEAVDLCESKDGKGPPTSEELTAMLLQAEEKTLHQICHKIADTFTLLAKRKVICSVRLYDEDRKLAVLWARSEQGLERDNNDEYNELSFGTGRNTALDEAVKRRSSGPSRYFCNDLLKARDASEFTSQRSGWETAYKSCLYVPIICRDGDEGEADLLGWLYVDTMSRNRLNDTYHVELLAAFADQMYNFISIMRSGYNIPEVA